MSAAREIPLFPLGTVLVCGGRLPLRIFEPRYLDLVARCVKNASGFGVVLIREGREIRRAGDDAPAVFEIGTYAKIVDFNEAGNGRLGILCAGGERFSIRRSWEAADKVLTAEVEFLAPEPPAAVNDEFRGLVDTLRLLLKHPVVQRLGLEVDYDDARSVGWRLAELLPLEARVKQELLELRDPRERLLQLRRTVSKLRG